MEHLSDRANNSLSENDALTILEDLLPAQNDSRFLARTLSLPEHTVQALHNENADQKERLYRVIVEFLRQAEPTPTWRAILDALRSPTVDRPRLAEEIERKRGFHTPAKESQSLPDSETLVPDKLQALASTEACELSQAQQQQLLTKKFMEKEVELAKAEETIRRQKLQITELEEQLRSSEAQVGDFQQGLQQRDSKLKTLPQTRTRRTTSHPSQQLKVQCFSKKRAPWSISRGSATTDHQFAYLTPADSPSLYRCALSNEQWEQLPSCPNYNSTLVVIDDELTTVGGDDSGYSYSNKLFTLKQRKWVEEYPPMKTERSSPGVISTCDRKYVLVIGGRHGDDSTATVELFQVMTRRWYETSRLPKPLPWPSAAICGDQVHVISGGHVGDYSGYSTSLQALLSIDQPITSQSLSHLLSWNPLPRLPVALTTAATLCGQLVIIGGQPLANSIHQLVEGQWVEIGSMTSDRWWCLSVSPSPRKLMIVGGISRVGFGAPSSVEECTIAY